MVRNRFIIGLLALAALTSCGKGDNDPRLVIITFDGLRWQEVFRGAEPEFACSGEYSSDPEAATAAWVRATPEESREALLPFLWSYVPKHGFMLGNRDKDSRMGVSNGMSFSYPGYSEMFCGWADDARIRDNDPVPNPNTSVLEVVNKDPRYKGRVMVYSSWESIRFAMNNDRGGFPGSSGHEPPLSDTPVSRLALQMDASIDSGSDERPDAITYAYALETLKHNHPKVFYVGFGGTDGAGHTGKYDLYLKAANYTDGFIRGIVEACESDPFYKGKTTYLITTDHGRGAGNRYRFHAASTRGSDQTWVMMFGKGVEALGETSCNGPFYNKQVAATIADVLGVGFTPDNGVECPPFDPSYYVAEEATHTPERSFKAVGAVPKGKGIRYAYNEGDFMSVGEVLAAPVKKRGIWPEFSTAFKDREDHFGIVFDGLMKIDRTATYLLSIATDDGAKFFLDGELLWDLDYDGGGFKQGWIELEAGFHRIGIQYFENYGDDSIEIGLIGEGLDYENLPPEMLYHE